MYNWFVFLHVLFAFLFMLAHGVHAAAMLKFRGEADPERALTFFHIVPPPTLVRVLTVLLGVPAFGAVAIAGWWAKGWVWASVVVFIVISIVMYYYGAGYFSKVQAAAQHLIEVGKSGAEREAAMQEFEKVRSSRQPMIVSAVGVAGLAIILWLMRFKPF